MKSVFAVFVMLIASLGFAEEPDISGTPDKRDIKQMRENLFSRMGGFVMDTRNAKGVIAVVDAQPSENKVIKEDDVAPLLESLIADTWLQFRRQEWDGEPINLASIVAMDVQKKMSERQWSLALIMVDEPNLPLQIVRQDELYGIVNIAHLKEGCEDNHTRLAKRTRVELMRVLAILTGCNKVPAAGWVGMPVKSAKDLDLCIYERLPSSVAMAIQQVAMSFGVYPMKRCWYYNALKEGWAPLPPKDKYQQSAYDRFISEQKGDPSSPMTIRAGQKPVNIRAQ